MASATSYYLTTIYASNLFSERLILWQTLIRFSGLMQASSWCVGGDFNEVRYSSEKLGGRPIHSRRVRKFNNCLISCSLEDLKSTGHTMSWCNQQESRICCRLDRILGNPPFFSDFPHAVVNYLPPGPSDHAALCLQPSPPIPAGPRPFRYFEMWEDHPQLALVVEEAWKQTVFGSPLFQMVKRLSNVKAALKVWNQTVFGNLKHQLHAMRELLESAQKILHEDPFNMVFIMAEANARTQYNSALKTEECFLRQKSRQLWLQLGDKNTKYFYSSFKARLSRNTISCLRTADGALCSDPSFIKNSVVSYFTELLNRDSGTTVPPLTFPRTITQTQNILLIDAITMEEVKHAVFSLKALSSPGPDGFPARFYQRFCLSGLELNSAKSQIFSTCSNSNLTDCLGIRLMQLPVRYLGIPLFSGCSHTKKLHHVNWLTVCKREEEGGLGIKNLADWNTGSQGVRFWDLVSNRSSLWSTWVKLRYLRRTDIWNHSPPQNSSGSWKQIIKSRRWIIGSVRYITFEGKYINIWKDPWLNGRSLTTAIGRELFLWGPPKSTTLSVLIQNEKWVKPNRWSSALDTLWEEIQNIEVGGTGEDILIWPQSRSGILTYKEAWKAQRSSPSEPTWTGWLWHSTQSRRHCFCAWQFFLNKLPTLERLHRKGLVQNLQCHLCASAVESSDHLALQCSFSRYIWLSLFRAIGIRQPPPSNLDQFPDWLKSLPFNLLTKTIGRLIVSNTLWALWQERNARIFRGKSKHKNIILRQIKSDIKLQLSKITLKLQISPDLNRIAEDFGIRLIESVHDPIIVKWEPPPKGWIKSNSDGSLSEDRGGYGALLRNDSSNFLVGSAGRSSLPSINLLELKGIISGLTLGLLLGSPKICFESDSTTALAWAKGKGSPPWAALRLLRKLWQGLAQLKEWRFQHVYREGNCPADLLASRKQTMGEQIIYPLQTWTELEDAIKLDKEGSIYIRR
ncbi:hypothetical protein QJS10_CPA08g00990 [Acorus calamus]|uniref:Reverse transcriptase zinc-binding domain-containing protein n=1 Tax=Acorus calamus TaxID=4465 RepID=A0AAV9EAW9_ACOCL|nr:hypothetical protein QJS10_CPA08g00990 [Acorus calamus]